jgi:hypothetical protein
MEPATLTLIFVIVVMIKNVINDIKDHEKHWMQREDGWFCGKCAHQICPKCKKVLESGRECCQCKARWFSWEFPRR